MGQVMDSPSWGGDTLGRVAREASPHRRHLKTAEGSSQGEIRALLLQAWSSDQQHPHHRELVKNTDAGLTHTCSVRILIVADAQGMRHRLRRPGLGEESSRQREKYEQRSSG